MSRLFFLTVVACCMQLFSVNLYAQANPALHGKVTTSDGQPVKDAAIILLETRQQTVTGHDGSYHFDHVRNGTYLIKASILGLPAIKKTITVTNGANNVVDFTLSETEVGLREVVITTRPLGKELNKESETVAKLPLKYLENPQVYTTLSDKLFTEQVVTDLSDGLKNAPGIVKMQGSIGRSGDGAVYYNLRGFPTRISMVDGLPGQTNGEIDVANVQSIEIIKGPSGTLFGGAVTSFGGLINVETKKPVDTLGGEVSYTAGSYDLSRISADIYGSLNKSKTLTARVNTAYHTRNSFQDAGFRKSFFLAPVINYRVSDRTNITLAAEFYSYEGTNPSIIFLSRTRKFFAATPKALNFDWSRSYTSNDLTLKAPSVNVHGRVDHQLGKGWVSSTSFSRNSYKTNGIYQYEFVRGNDSDDKLERNVQLQNADAGTTSIQQNFTGDFRIGTLRNRLIVGVDYLNQTANVNNSGIVKFDTISGSNPDSRRYTQLSLATATNKIALSSIAAAKTYNSRNTYGVYASDVINITDNLLAMLSLRLDYFASNGTNDLVAGKMVPDSRYYQTALSPKFGLVYQILPGKVSVFGNYMNGFSNVPPVTQPVAGINGNFKPQQANQVEGGVKLDLLDNRLTFTASYYDISVSNIIRPDIAKVDGTVYNISVQDGTQKSKGVELELMAAPVRGLNIMAGYSHNDSKLNNAGKDVDGIRPASAGPADIANAWISYTISAGKLRGFGAGVGGNYVSEHVTANTPTTGTFTFPAYTLLNATVFYDARKFRAGLKFDNITNAEYFVGQGVISPQMPFNFSANVTVKF